jgi:cell division protease FtsH
MTDYITFLSGMCIGIYIAMIYKYLSVIEPFCFYLPGGIGQYYKVHKEVVTKFNDVIGSDDIKKELNLHLKFFAEKKLTKGWLFEGPNGSGKTLMAKAIAGESNLPFIEIFTNDIKDSHIPTVLNSVIRKYSPCVIFIDECSKIINDYKDTFLRGLDGINSLDKIFLVLATDKPLPKAITRSGRIDKIIHFGLPSDNDRLEWIKKKQLTNPQSLTKKTVGFSFSDLDAIIREIEFNKLCYPNKTNEELQI